jgi:hypothetical protein
MAEVPRAARAAHAIEIGTNFFRRSRLRPTFPGWFVSYTHQLPGSESWELWRTLRLTNPPESGEALGLRLADDPPGKPAIDL